MSLKIAARVRLLFRSPRHSRSALGLVALLAAVCGAPSVTAASEIVVQNDSMPPVGDPLPRTPSNFRFGAWLDAPVDGTIVGVQVLWGSESGGAAPSEQIAIHISPFNPQSWTPGSPWATIDSPVLVDGALNEFRYLDPATNLQPLSVPVHAGDSFLVDLELFPVDTGAPSILLDTDGESSINRNLFQTGQQGWVPLRFTLVSLGDLGIRVIIQPVPEPSTYILSATALFGLFAFRRRPGICQPRWSGK